MTFVNLLFNLHVTDTQSGLKIIKKDCLAKILPKVLVKRFAFDLELLVNARHNGFRVIEAPIKINYNFANGTMVNVKAVKGIFLE